MVTGQAINTDLGTSCSCGFGQSSGQAALNVTYSDAPQSINQQAPAEVNATAFNGGFGFNLGGWFGCGCGQFYGSNGSNGVQNATAIAAAAPVQYASEAEYTTVSGRATNINLGNSGSYGSCGCGSYFGYQGNGNNGNRDHHHGNNGGQFAGNFVISTPEQSIRQNAGSDVTANAVNLQQTNSCYIWCGSNSNSGNQSATAIAASAPSQTANESLMDNVSGSATNLNTGNSSNCGCGSRDNGRGNGSNHGQLAINVTLSSPDQHISQWAPTDVSANATNYPGHNNQEWGGCGCGNNSFGSVQNATAIAAAQPEQSASSVYTGQVSGQALNTSLSSGCSSCYGSGSGSQLAFNFTNNDPSQRIDQNGHAVVSADAKNLGFGGAQDAFAASVAAPRQVATQYESVDVAGAATNLALSGNSGNQVAVNFTENRTHQSIDQDAPVYANAYATNYPQSNHHGRSNGGFGGDQIATAIAGAAPVQTASQSQWDGANGAATNLNLGSSYGFNSGCGCNWWNTGRDQQAFNTTTNISNQRVNQWAPANVFASAKNEGASSFWGCYSVCYGGSQNATAIATSAASQHANQTAFNGVSGRASNVSLSDAGICCWCGCNGGSSQYASNDSYHLLNQRVWQNGRTDVDAFAHNYPSFSFGPWGGFGGGSSCGCYGSSLSGLGANVAYAMPTYRAPILSTPYSLSGPSLNGICNAGCSNLNFGGSDLGISLGLSINNSASLNLPSITQLLHGVSLFDMLHGMVSVSLHLSVTTPWVQIATAVAQETPFTVLFSASEAHGLAPWYGYLL